ncbi:MAG: M20/M25/M40 family metallo-hydrolase [Chloroflexota bacterium]
MLIHENPAAVLQSLIRFDTTNPPGNERACIDYINGLLQAAGIETTLLARDDNRPNLIARLRGAGSAPPFLMQGHVDVVTTANQQWTHPPFEAVEQDGFIWGRGTLDMKGGVAMMLCAMLKMKHEMDNGNATPAGDILLCVMSDEEAGGEYGAKWLVENHPEQFDGVKYAIGEFGGSSMHLHGKKFYIIQMAEKVSCQIKLSIHGPAGHASSPQQGGTMARLGKVLTRLDEQQLPVHVTPVVQKMVEGIADAIHAPYEAVLQQTLAPASDSPLGVLMRPMFRNTASPTIVHGGDKINVIPGLVELSLDGRMLPGMQPAQFVDELKAVIGDDLAEHIDMEVVKCELPELTQPDMTQFDMLAGILRELDTDANPIPYLLPAGTDGSHFARLGIQNYGFTPMLLPESFNFGATIHAADERIPVEAVAFGTEAIFMVLQRYK